MADEFVRFGVVGVGGMGSGHCNMISKIPEARLTAVSDVDEPTLKAVSEKFAVAGFSDPIQLLDSGLVDAIIIATPHYFHPPIAIAAFERGIHVLSEKPLAVSVSDADAMIEAARRSGCKFGIMYQMRTEPHHFAAKQIVNSGALGEIYRTSLVMGWYRSQAYYNSGGWRATWAGEGGGVLINQAPHYLDLFCWLAGLPASIHGTTRTRLHQIEVEDEAFALLTYPNGAHGYLYASTMEVPNHNMLEICADRGKIVLHGSRLQYFRVEGSIREFTFSTKEMWGSPKVTEEPVNLPEEKPLKGHSAITQNFARAILYNEPLLAPGEEGLNAMELINGIILSSKTEQVVHLPVDRAAYDALLAQLKAQSKSKTVSETQRITDPNYA